MVLHCLVRSFEESIMFFDTSVVHYIVTYWPMLGHFFLNSFLGFFDLRDLVIFYWQYGDHVTIDV